VDAVLFYAPTCPHCHEVIDRHLPPLRERYGEQFVIVGVDVSTPGGSSLYDAAVEYYGLAPDRLGVPLLIVGDVTLLGSREIPERLPGLIEEGLAAGGTPWPTLPALREALTAQGLVPRGQPPEAASPAAPDTAGGVGPPAPATDAPDSTRALAATSDAPAAAPVEEGPPPAKDAASHEEAAPSESPFTTSLIPSQGPVSPTPAQRFLQDPVGNGIAVAVLCILLATLAVGVLALGVEGPPLLPSSPGWAIPALAVAGLAIAVYLSLVEVTGTVAVCGPVGDCNRVQQSEYALLFGVAPVGILGALGYLGILAAWGVATRGPVGSRRQARLSLWILAFLGTAFSAYLTFLEPFVIGATCAWCVGSALLMALLLLSATNEVRRGR
jgi:uncharacterized membrane protein/thiol-disulfide isomerase/thioredoxin